MMAVNNKNSYYIFLISLFSLPFLIIAPVLPTGEQYFPIAVMCLTLLIIGCIPSLFSDRKKLIIGCMFTMIMLELFWMAIFSSSITLFVSGESVFLLFMLIVGSNLVDRITRLKSEIFTLFFDFMGLILVSGQFLGTALHLSSLFNLKLSSLSEVIAGFISSILDGIIMITPLNIGIDIDLSPLTKVVLTAGSFMAYGILALVIWKIVKITGSDS